MEQKYCKVCNMIFFVHKQKHLLVQKYCTQSCSQIDSMRKYAFITKEDGCIECVSHKSSHANGYPIGSFDGKPKRMNRFIWERAYGKLDKGLIVRHKCDNPACINIEHLESGTNKDNTRDMVERGRNLVGEQSPHSKLTESNVREIRTSTLSIRAMSRMYGVDRKTIKHAKNHITWKHVV